MLKHIRIENFRNFSKFEVHKLKRLNFIAGRNGGGKTSLLEAIFLNCGAANASLVMSLNAFRGDNTLHPEADRTFRSCFHNMDPLRAIQIYTTDERRHKSYGRLLRLEAIITDQVLPGQSAPRRLVTGIRATFQGQDGETKSKIEWHPNALDQLRQGKPPSPQEIIQIEGGAQPDLIFAQYLSPYFREGLQQIHQRLGDAIRNKALERVIKTVNVVDENVRNLVPLTEHGQETIYVDSGGPEMLPIHVMGSGFYHVLNLALSINSIDRGIIIADELEDGLHYSILERVANIIIGSLKQKKELQFFVATHSSELIRAFDTAAQKSNFSEICLINLSNTKRGYTYFEPDEFHDAIEMEAELR